MKFKEIASRLTGISIPIFGVSWNPPKAHVTVAKKVITFLEDKRVLYNPYHLEDPRHCIESINEIRQFLTVEIGELNDAEGLPQSLRAMRAACRKILDIIQSHNLDALHGFQNGASSWIFNSALGELRGVFGIHLASIATQHGLDMEDELAAILPQNDNDKTPNQSLKLTRKSPARRRLKS